MSQIIFDAGIFISLLIVGFLCWAFYKKTGAVILIVSIVSFLIAGLVVVTGEDVAFYKITNPINETITVKNLTSGSITQTTFHSITPSNETDYLIGNGQLGAANSAQIGAGQLIFGYSLLLLSLILGVIFLDQAWKGNLVKGD